MKKRRFVWRALLVVLVALVAALAWYRFASRHVPAGQPLLATLDATSLASVREDFNRHVGQVRMIVLLSPT